MDDHKLKFYKKLLDDLETEILEDLNQGNQAAEPVQLDTSIGRLSRMDAIQSQQMAMEMQRRLKNRLMRIENARKRMAKGNYGLCGKCSQPISEDRLEFQPDTVFCIGCASK